MTAHKRCTWLVAGLMLCAGTNLARGQDYGWVNNSDHDLQFFSPTEFDFDSLVVRKDCGFTFRYDKLSWAFTGERATVGCDDVVQFHPDIWPENPLSIGTAPENFLLTNGLRNVPPRATFGWGERYDLGYYNGNAGWNVEILDGPEVRDSQLYGFQEGNPPLDPASGFAVGNVTLGFGGVVVLFKAPMDFALGWRDYAQNGAEANGTSFGPILYVGNLGDNVNVLNRVPEDLNQNGVLGPFDYDDLFEFVFVWETVEVRNVTETQGVEIMRSHTLDNNHRMAKHQNNTVEFSYGARFLRLRDFFGLSLNGGTYGLTTIDTRIDNQIVGPQARLKWSHQRGKFNWTATGSILFGYNIQDYDQDVQFGQELIPGGLNRPLYGMPEVSAHGKQDNEFSPVAELRVNCAYQLTSAVALNLGYNAMLVDNIRRATQQVNYTLPSVGFRDGGTQEIFINGVNFGFDVVY